MEGFHNIHTDLGKVIKLPTITESNESMPQHLMLTGKNAIVENVRRYAEFNKKRMSQHLLLTGRKCQCRNCKKIYRF